MQTTAHDAALANKSTDESKVDVMEKIKELAATVLSGLLARTIATFLVSAFLIGMIVDVAYPSFTTSTYNQIAGALADEARQTPPTAKRILQAMQQHNLSWYYLTDVDGNVSPLTQPYCPELTGPTQNVSRNVDWNNKAYWEAVAAVDSRHMLHVGFYISPVVFSQLGSRFAMVEPCPMGVVIFIFWGVAASVAAMLYFCVIKPMQELCVASRAPCSPQDASLQAEQHLELSTAVSEIKRLGQAIEELRGRHAHALATQAMDAGDQTGDRASAKGHHENFNVERLAEFYSKDAEEEFINNLNREVEALKSSHQVCQRILDKLNDKFPTSIIYGAFFKTDQDQRFVAEAFLGFDDRTVQNLKRIDHARIASETFSVGSYLSLDHKFMRDYGLQSVLSGNSIKTGVYLPLSFQGRNLGMLAVYFTTEGKTVQDRLRFLRNVVSVVSRSLYEVVIYEEELQAALTDPLTGVRNKKFLQDVLPKAFARAAVNPDGNPVALAMMHGDHFADILDTVGSPTSDLILQELAKTIRQCVRTSDSDGKSGPGDFLIRYGGEEFVILMENTDAARACDIAERIRTAVAHKTDWPGGITKWSLSIGVATYPADAKNTEDLLVKANRAVYYVKEVMGCNKTCHVKQVPESFKSGKETAAIGGELGVFDPSALLQSLSTAQKSGILTVQGAKDKQLWVLFENGKLLQARLGKFAGAAAIVEFVTTFDEGSFSFQEKVMGPKETLIKLPKLDSTYNVNKGLERCLMDGALAQDNFNAAKAIISSPETTIRPIAAVEFSARWQALSQLPEPPTSEEFNIMSDIVQKADGKTTLTEIFQSMDDVLTAQSWRCAALLVQHSLVSKKPAVPV